MGLLTTKEIEHSCLQVDQLLASVKAYRYMQIDHLLQTLSASTYKSFSEDFVGAGKFSFQL